MTEQNENNSFTKGTSTSDLIQKYKMEMINIYNKKHIPENQIPTKKPIPRKRISKSPSPPIEIKNDHSRYPVKKLIQDERSPNINQKNDEYGFLQVEVTTAKGPHTH